MTVKIANCGHNENGNYTGGKAGDQTGGEWVIRDWYSRPWNVVLRHPKPKVRALLAKYAKQAAKNNHIGYDQSNRESFWEALKSVLNYAPKNITKDCETDCSCGVLTIAKAVGYKLGIAKMKNIDISGYTGNMASILTKAGFKKLTDSKYLTSDKYLLEGDVLLNTQHHTAYAITNGSNAKKKAKTITDKLVQEVIDGKYGDGEVRQKNLESLGYDYAEVQAAVNRLLG